MAAMLLLLAAVRVYVYVFLCVECTFDVDICDSVTLATLTLFHSIKLLFTSACLQIRNNEISYTSDLFRVFCLCRFENTKRERNIGLLPNLI